MNVVCMTRVGIVLRCSTQEQADSRLGLDSQLQNCLEAAARECPGMEVQVFSDPGVSGAIPLAERKEGRQLTEAIVAGEISIVIALSQDRLFRSMLDALATFERWDDVGVRVFLCDGGWIDLDSDEQWAVFVVRAFAAELERRNARKRTARALQAARDDGRRIGGLPLGYRSTAYFDETGRKHNGGIWESVPEELAAVARIRQLREQAGLSFREIARELQREGTPTKRGGRWQSEQVRRAYMREIK